MLRAASSARAGRALGLAEGDDVFGERQDVGGTLEEGDRLVEVAGSDRQPALPGERRGMSGHEREGPSVGGRGSLRVARVDEQVAEQRLDEGDVLRCETGRRRRCRIALNATSSLPWSSATYETRASVVRSARIASISSAAASASS